MMSWKKLLLAATVLALPATGHAQRLSGFYVGAAAGVNFAQDSDLSLQSNPFARAPLGLTGAQRQGSASFETGYALVGSLGYGFGNGLRAEVEINYRQNDVDSITGFGAPAGVRSSGRIRAFGAMVNALYDFDLGLPVTPYIGGGIGGIMVDPMSLRQRGPGLDVFIPGSELVFGYQAIVGASLPLDSVLPGFALTAEYRYMATLDGRGDGASATRPNGVGARGNAEWEYSSHAVLLGLRYALNAPAPAPVVAPAPAPAAAPAPARTFLVFFDFDRADLTDRARQIIAEAAQSAGRVQTTRIEVSGHADRSGTPQYNQRLSERRAAAVAAELERRGIARNQITVQAFGESRPLVPTADGVREPQNRRVEIVLR